MMKLLGSLLILTGGGLLRWKRLQAGQRRRRALEDLIAALRAMSEEIRMARTPMPRLLRRQAEVCGKDVQVFLEGVAASAAGGGCLADAWRRGASDLPLDPAERALLLGLELHGDEEQICKALSLVSTRLERRAEEQERRRPEEVKRVSALCFSGAALLVILLI